MHGESGRGAKHSAASCSSSASPSPPGVDNRQVVTSGVERGRLFNVAAVCNARELVCSSVSSVCFDFPLSCRLKTRSHGSVGPQDHCAIY